MANDTEILPKKPAAATKPEVQALARHRPSWSLLILVIPILVDFVSTAIYNWNMVFDDSYISYRYAQNLAMGYGITWNPGLPPTEGYTNFLLVLMLAPFIKVGFDPLLVTRLLSLICAFGIAGILFITARRQFNCSATVSGMIAATIFLVPATTAHFLIGLETLLYAFLLLMTFIAGIDFIDNRQSRHAILFSCLLFLTMLTRPEAILMYPIVAVAVLVETIRHKSGLKPVIAGLTVLLCLGGAYLGWKYVHFGQLLPNPFYLKASGQSLINRDGLQSVVFFLTEYAPLLLLATLALLFVLVAHRTPENYRHRIITLTGFSFALLYCLFFVHVDTLMDAYGRFLYPMVPLIILLSIPAFAKASGFIESLSARYAFVLPVLMVAFLLIFAPDDVFKLYGRLHKLAFDYAVPANESFMKKELRIAKSLSQFPEIKQVRIAFADSGVIPYFTGAIWLDVVGLNDGFIARTHDRNKLIDYFFDWSPDLVIQPGRAGVSWLQTGHGPLGDYQSWSADPRWDGYEYAGTSKMNGIPYDLQYFVRKTSRYRGPLESFLRANVVDGWYDSTPLPIGTHHPQVVPATRQLP